MATDNQGVPHPTHDSAPPHRVIVVPWLRRPGHYLLLPHWLAITLGRWIFAWRELDEAELAHAQSDLRAINADIKRIRDDTGARETDERLKPYLAKRAEISALVDAYTAAAAGYNDWTQFDVALDLPDSLRLVTVHLKASGK